MFLGRRAVYELLSGNTAVASAAEAAPADSYARSQFPRWFHHQPQYTSLNVCRRMSWLRCLGLQLWFGRPAQNASIAHALAAYEQAVAQGAAAPPRECWPDPSDPLRTLALAHCERACVQFLRTRLCAARRGPSLFWRAARGRRWSRPLPTATCALACSRCTATNCTSSPPSSPRRSVCLALHCLAACSLVCLRAACCELVSRHSHPAHRLLCPSLCRAGFRLRWTTRWRGTSTMHCRFVSRFFPID